MNCIKVIIVLLGICFLNLAAVAQSTDSIEVIAVDRSVLSGVGLQKIDFEKEPEKQFYQKKIFRGEELSIYVVSTGSWVNQCDDFPFDEFIYIFHGSAEVRPDVGHRQEFFTGDYFFAPKGYTGEWEIKAGENLHYEFSIIATQRADSTQVSTDLNHSLFDPEVLSGTDIKLDKSGTYKKLLREGVELSVTLYAESPRELKIEQPSKEIIVHLLSGQIEIDSGSGTNKTFYTGDYFILPKGFLGTWKSEGHGIIKYLAIERTKN